MKTNMILNSPDRVLFGVQVRQETSTSFLNLSDLQDAYDSVRVQNGWYDRRIERITSTQDFRERTYYILEKQGIIKTSFSAFIEKCQKEGITKVLKDCGAWKTTGARHTKTTWCNPYIWVMIAMEMNPKLYAEVVMWLTDKLILNRIEAGNFYKEFTYQLQQKIKVPDYAKIAIEINKVVFGRHELGIRQVASEKQLKELYVFEQNLAYALKNNFINTEQELVNHIRKQNERHDN
jgi:hypothetical protein